MSASKQIAIIEDEPEVLALLSTTLTDAGYDIKTYSHAVDFEEALAESPPDLCIVDLGLPDKDGLGVVSNIAAQSDAAILVISGRTGLNDRITGLELGADDYLAKPFEPREVVARVRALIRRRAATTSPAETTIYRFSGWEVDFATFLLTDEKGATQRLSASEASLLLVFLKSAKRLITREQLQVALDDRSDSISFDRTIDVRVSRLRSKLNDKTRNPKIIKTIYGAGYIFISDVT
ncbi:response regulator transcription factor [Yoonia maritima]|uniref:response regulator transcription factor n=1 Tax=Yoonia maritima TaxID=1435347 RepID=UPI003736E99C